MQDKREGGCNVDGDIRMPSGWFICSLPATGMSWAMPHCVDKTDLIG